MRNIVLLLILTLFTLRVYGSSDYPRLNGPSFNCQKASTDIENEICSDNVLSGLDHWLAKVYSMARENDTNNELKRSQIKWLKNRSKCLEEAGGMSYHSSSKLHDCYVDRIQEIIRTYEIKRDDAFYLNLANRMGIVVRKEFIDQADQFVYQMNLFKYLRGFFDGHCSFNPHSILYYNSPILILSINGSTVCGGTSHRVSGKTEYCEKDDNFVRGSVWNCKPSKITDEDFLLTYLATHSFHKFSNSRNEPKNNIFIDYLYSFPIHGLSEPSAGHARHSRIFSDNFLEIFERNISYFLNQAEQHPDDLDSLIFGMSCVRDAIVSSNNWESTLKNSPSPMWYGNYWYGRQFKGCDDYNVKIVGQLYTYKELYTEFWRRLYWAGGMERATSLLEELKKRRAL